MQTPEIAFQIFEVLTSRIRSVQQRLESATARAQVAGEPPTISG